jgi:RNA polymerase sigma-70 factor, ECF subfamily
MALTNTEVKDIVNDILKGDKNKFRIIIKEYELMLRSFLATKLYQQQEVDDIAQETFITAFKKIEAFDTQKSMLSWLFGIAHNHLRNYFKTSKRRNNAMENFRDHVFTRIETDLVKVAENYQQEKVSKLLFCIGKLPEKLQTIIQTGLKGLQLDSLQGELTMNRNSIYQARFRANDMLRKCMQSSELKGADYE